MSKLSATLSKKVPIPGLEYSSQQFSCGIETELAGETTQESIKQTLRKMYALLHEAVNAEIRESAQHQPELPASQAPARDHPPARRWEGSPRQGYRGNSQPRWNSPRGGSQRRYGGGNGGNNSGRATQAQVKAIFAIAKANGIEREDLFERIREQFEADKPEELGVKEASQLIEALKENGVRE
jgi:hypothetical protein